MPAGFGLVEIGAEERSPGAWTRVVQLCVPVREPDSTAWAYLMLGVGRRRENGVYGPRGLIAPRAGRRLASRTRSTVVALRHTLANNRHSRWARCDPLVSYLAGILDGNGRHPVGMAVALRRTGVRTNVGNLTQIGGTLMKKILASLCALAFALTLGLANAEDAKGVIEQISPDNSWFTLKDGTKFTLAEGADMADIKAGDQVTVSYEMKDGQKVATEVSKDEG